MINKKLGNQAERHFIKMLSKKRYWNYLFPTTQCGQPCDVIAFNNNTLLMVDIKHCENNRFNTSRIEPNQRMTFDLVSSVRPSAIVGIVAYFGEETTPYFLPYTHDMKKSYEKKEMVLFEPILDI